MSTAARVRKLLLATSSKKRFSPTETHYGKPSKVSYLIVFGWLACYLDQGNRGKLVSNGKKIEFIGYDEESKAYLLIDLEIRQVVRARSLTFNAKIVSHDFMVDSELLQNLELSIYGSIDIVNQGQRQPANYKAHQLEGDTADSAELLKRIGSRRKQ